MGKKTRGVVMAGVGGQGTILASTILSEGLSKHGYDVKMSEIHGMAQRGGDVSTHIRFGEKVYSPMVGDGEADVVIAFEKVEALRMLPKLKSGGTLIVNDYEIYSHTVQLGEEKYPQNLIEKFKEEVENTMLLNANEIAEGLGNTKAQNVVMLGALVKALELNEINWVEVMKTFVKPQFHEVNIKALEAGMNI